MRRILTTLSIALALLSFVPALPSTATLLPAFFQRAGDPNVMVWVNTASGVYHCPGTRWYGRTKRGRYMRQRAAQAAGYRPAYGSVCG